MFALGPFPAGSWNKSFNLKHHGAATSAIPYVLFWTNVEHCMMSLQNFPICFIFLSFDVYFLIIDLWDAFICICNGLVFILVFVFVFVLVFVFVFVFVIVFVFVMVWYLDLNSCICFLVANFVTYLMNTDMDTGRRTMMWCPPLDIYTWLFFLENTISLSVEAI